MAVKTFPSIGLETLSIFPDFEGMSLLPINNFCGFISLFLSRFISSCLSIFFPINGRLYRTFSNENSYKEVELRIQQSTWGGWYT